MSQHNRSKWNRHSRLAVDNELSFERNTNKFSYALIDTGQLSTYLAISFFSEINEDVSLSANHRLLSLTKNTSAILNGISFVYTDFGQSIEVRFGDGVSSQTKIINVRTGLKIHIFLIFNILTSACQIYVNSKRYIDEIIAVTIPATTFLDLSVSKTFSADVNGGVNISNLVLFNNTVDSGAVNTIFSNGGVIPESLHGYVIRHNPYYSEYSLAQRIRQTDTGLFTAGFASVETIPPGTDGYVECYCNIDSGFSFCFGLSTSNTDETRDTIEFCMFLADSNRVFIFESGVNITQISDRRNSPQIVKLKITREGSDIVYYAYDVEVYRNIGGAPSGSLLLDCSSRSGIAGYYMQEVKLFDNTDLKHVTFTDLVNIAVENIATRVIDVVEQYNYAKVIPLAANHGVLVNYTEGELFGKVKPDGIKSFYGDEILGLNTGYRFEGGTIWRQWGAYSKTKVTTPITSAFAVYVKFQIGKFMDVQTYSEYLLQLDSTVFRLGTNQFRVPTVGGFALANLSSSDGIDIADKDQFKVIEMLINVPSANPATWELNYVLNENRKEKQGTVTVSAYTGTTINTFLDDVILGNRRLRAQGPDLGDTLANIVFYDVAIYNNVLTASERAAIYDKSNVNNSNCIEHFNCRDFESDTGELTTPNLGIVMQTTERLTDTSTGSTLSDTLPVRGDKSTFEVRKKALSFNGTIQYLRVPNFSATNENGYTIIIGKALDSDRLITTKSGLFDHQSSVQFSNLGGCTNVSVNQYNGGSNTFNPNIYQWQSGVNTDIDLSKLTIVSVVSFESSKLFWNGFQVAVASSLYDFTQSAEFRIGQDYYSYLQGFIAYFALIKGQLTQKELLELNNNTLLRNPSIKIQNKYSLELFVDFNNPFDDGGTLKFPDLSPNNHEVIAEGYTDLADLQTSLVDINSLR